MKFPFITSLGEENGWYRVGPLARINNCEHMRMPLADAAREEFMALGKGLPVGLTGTALIDLVSIFLTKGVIREDGAFAADIDNRQLPHPAPVRRSSAPSRPRRGRPRGP